jgi:hypothetical protein
MPNPIQLKRSTTAGNTPSSLAQGEVAINIPDRLAYVVDGSGMIRNFNLTSDTEKVASGPIATALAGRTPYNAMTGVASAGAIALSGTGSTGDVSTMSVAPSATAAAGTLALRAAGVVTLDGTRTDTDVQNAINSVPTGASISIRFPATARITLNNSPTANGRVVSWDIDPQATFSGTGTLPGPTSPTFYAPDYRKMRRVHAKGSTAAPTADLDPILLFNKTSNGAAGLNATIGITGTKVATGDATAVSSLTVDAYDIAGWPNTSSGNNNFIEAIRANAYLAPGANNGSCYGIVAGAGSGDANTPFRFYVGAEFTVFNNYTDAPPTQSFAPGTSISASLDLTTDSTKQIDAFALTNPYISGGPFKPARAGFFVTAGSITDAAFVSQSNSLYGLDLTKATNSTAQIGLSNTGTIKARNAAGTGFITVLYVDASNNVNFGQASSTNIINGPIYSGSGAQFTGTVGFTQNLTYDFGSGANRARKVYSGAVNLSNTFVPSSSSDPSGEVGDVITPNNGYLYWKDSSGWKRVQGSTF